MQPLTKTPVLLPALLLVRRPIISFLLLLLIVTACRKGEVIVTAVTPPPGNTVLTNELIFEELHWEIRTTTSQLISWLDIPDSYSATKLTLVRGEGESSIIIPKYNGSTTQLLYYITSFKKIGIYKYYMGDPPRRNQYDNVVEYGIAFTYFIKDNVGFHKVKLNF